MTRTPRKIPLRSHPFWEHAQLIRDLLREDARAARKGVVVIPGDPDTVLPRLRAEAQHLERLARLDVDYPEDK